MQCSKCSSTKVLVESASPTTSRLICQSCGHIDLVNGTGKRMLTDEVQPPVSRPRFLSEG